MTRRSVFLAAPVVVAGAAAVAGPSLPAAGVLLVGLVVVTFAFLGVNMFLTGLHSYGTL